MNSQKLTALLLKLHACKKAKDWAKGKSLTQAWETCERADWMIWLVGCMIGTPCWPSQKEVVKAVCSCVEPALQYCPENELRPSACIEVVRKWASGKATIDEVLEGRESAGDAWTDAGGDVAGLNVTGAAMAAVWAAAWASGDIAWASRPVSWAGWAISWSSGTTDRSAALKHMADVVRSMITLKGVT